MLRSVGKNFCINFNKNSGRIFVFRFTYLPVLDLSAKYRNICLCVFLFIRFYIRCNYNAGL